MILPPNMNAYEHGIWLGYPKCCVEAFERKTHLPQGKSGTCGPRERRVLYGTGFVPCRTCSENNTEEELIIKINANRKDPWPFKRYAPAPL